MKIAKSALRRFLREAVESDRILAERPWSVEYTFTMSGDAAEDSEGPSADGFAVVMKSEAGIVMRVVVDSYWNPQSGDQSGNSIKIEVDKGEGPSSPTKNSFAHVPHQFDDGTEQKLIISNSPVPGVICVSHSFDDLPPITYLAVSNPFHTDDDDISFEIEKLGSGDVKVELTDHVNI